MRKRFFVISLIFLLLFVFRLTTLGGFNKTQKNPELEEAEMLLEPARSFLSSYSTKLLAQPEASLLTGMVLGVKSDLPAEFKEALRRTSTIHIVVVSGQNLTMLAGFLFMMAPLLGRKKTLALSAVVVLAYAFLTGLQVPVIRAAIMAMFGFGASFFDREGDSFWILILAAMAMLIYNPNWVLSVSFQLSFLATVGVVILSPELIANLKFVPNILRQDLAVSFAAQALTWPVIAANFHQFSVVGLLTNLLVLPCVPLVMITGAISILAALIDISLGQLFVIVPGALLTYFVNIVNFSNQNWASLYVGNMSQLLYLGYYSLLLGFFLCLKKINSTRI